MSINEIERKHKTSRFVSKPITYYTGKCAVAGFGKNPKGNEGLRVMFFLFYFQQNQQYCCDNARCRQKMREDVFTGIEQLRLGQHFKIIFVCPSECFFNEKKQQYFSSVNVAIEAIFFNFHKIN